MRPRGISSLRAHLTMESLPDRLVPNAAPQIVSFNWEQVVGDVYMFYGTVEDDTDPTGYIVELGGAPEAVQGLRAEVQSDGSFCIFVEIGVGDGGPVEAITWDLEDLASDIAYEYVTPM